LEKSIFGNNLKNNFFSKERFGTYGHTTKRNILGDFEQNRRGSLQNRVEVAWNDPMVISSSATNCADHEGGQNHER